MKIFPVDDYRSLMFFGQDKQNCFNDFWMLDCDAGWLQKPSSSLLEGRSFFDSVYYQDQLFVMGGKNTDMLCHSDIIVLHKILNTDRTTSGNITVVGDIRREDLVEYFESIYQFRRTNIGERYPFLQGSVTSYNLFSDQCRTLGGNKAPFSDITVYLKNGAEQLHSIMLKKYRAFSQILDQVEVENGKNVIHWETIGHETFEMILYCVYNNFNWHLPGLSEASAINTINRFLEINLPFMVERVCEYIARYSHQFNLYELYWLNQELELPKLSEVINRELRMNYLHIKNDDEFKALPKEYKKWIKENYHPGDDYIKAKETYEKALREWRGESDRCSIQ
eukprot:TRINITY_DN5240_c0_g1_i2.p1 TRINITY_DN5240_c0_g1~~TRINITY_DN5240_c0_g1_i2.p1  ORF type:complete len:337 (+),score=60.92 TRINITY_DN5240_c0_g1_i2:257-1267(+)